MGYWKVQLDAVHWTTVDLSVAGWRISCDPGQPFCTLLLLRPFSFQLLHFSHHLCQHRRHQSHHRPFFRLLAGSTSLTIFVSIISIVITTIVREKSGSASFPPAPYHTMWYILHVIHFTYHSSWQNIPHNTTPFYLPYLCIHITPYHSITTL